MKLRILNLMILLSSFFGYLEWGKNQKLFLFQAEYDVFKKIFSDLNSVLHPLIILPLIAQLILLVTLFQKYPSIKLIWIGIIGLAILFLFMFFVGCISMNLKIVLSTLPFIILSLIFIFRKRILA
ncbi:MAG TPA: hypothetical protein PLU17_08525 [Chitinophagaceae bacterium]|nr:hypothetical protein [Chitinophagaceae bacterium]